MTIWRMRIACRIPTANKYTHSGCVILIALPQQQWLHERALMLRYTYTDCLSSPTDRQNFLTIYAATVALRTNHS